MYSNILEEELKNNVAQDWFQNYNHTKIMGKIDFCIASKSKSEDIHSFFWAEAKRGNPDIYESIVQLIMTIGKARTFDTYLPPKFIGAFDYEKIAFIPYSDIHDIFYINDFNWSVTSSDHTTREFGIIFERVKEILNENSMTYRFDDDHKMLKNFIKENFTLDNLDITKTRIDKNNFMIIYNKWLSTVKDSIGVDWKIANKSGIIDGDFYLADLLSENNKTLKDKLYVLLENDKYRLDRKIDKSGLFSDKTAQFRDNQKAHHGFWNRYERPPKEEYWEYIIERRDLLVPQDIRERKGSFFTPQIWVEKSQEYIANVLGENWQDEYTVWDCAPGTGNLFNGLSNKYNLYASTLDKQDVDVIHERIASMGVKGSNLLKEHVFQFDFLNDSFDKLPKGLKAIIDDPKKRKKLLIYINPPYAEHGNKKIIINLGRNKSGVTKENHKIYDKYKNEIGGASRELFALFISRIYKEIPLCTLAQFSTMKFANGSNFEKFRNYFKAQYLGGFIVPAKTFDNVKGEFPIGFTVWQLDQKKPMDKVKCDIYDEEGLTEETKTFYGNLSARIGQWQKNNNEKTLITLGYYSKGRNDFQHAVMVYIVNLQEKAMNYNVEINMQNLIESCIYLSVHHAFKHTWINHNDQFTIPNDEWKNDTEFHSDCLAFTLFHGRNKITAREGVNHWIPFTEQEVDAKAKFESSFMTDFIAGRIQPESNPETMLDTTSMIPSEPIHFSKEAVSVFDAGRELWRYYHQQDIINPNASFYDIKEYFQGRNDKGRMNSKSDDSLYTQKLHELKLALENLKTKIQPKVYEYGFLKE